MPKVVGIGDLSLDLILEIDKIPGTNCFEPLSEGSMQGGGKVPTALVALARLGMDAGLAAPVGDDRFGSFCMEELKLAGVDTSRMVIRKNTRTNFCVCLAEQSTKGRSFIGKLGDVESLKPEELDREYIAGAEWLYLWKMDETAKCAASWIHEAGGRVAIDADRYHEEIERGFDRIDLFIGSEYFWHGMKPGGRRNVEGIKETLVDIVCAGPSIAVITLGEKGLCGMDENGFFYVPAYQVGVKDTTGAGDVFHGAYLCGLMKGMDARGAGTFAAAVSAIKCTALGGRAGIPDYNTAIRFMETGELESGCLEPWIAYYRSAFYEKL